MPEGGLGRVEREKRAAAKKKKKPVVVTRAPVPAKAATSTRAASPGRAPTAAKAAPKKAPPKKKTRVVRVSVPSMEASLYNQNDVAPPKKTKPKKTAHPITPTMMDVKPRVQKARPHAFEKTPVGDWYAENLLQDKRTKHDQARIDRVNQAIERDRRQNIRQERAARQARRAEVRKAVGGRSLPHEVRSQLQDYIKNGPQEHGPGAWDIAKAIGSGVFHGTAGKVADFESRLSAGLQYRESGREISAEDDPLTSAAGDLAVGPNIIKAIRGEDYDPWMFGVEMAGAMIPVKGLPSGLTALLRGALGTGRILRAIRKGETVADVLRASNIGKELNTPVWTARATRRAALRAEDAPRASSPIAGAVARHLPEGSLIQKIVRNDPSTTRAFTQNGGTETIPAALSRLWKFGIHPLIDKHRGSKALRVGSLGIIKPEDAMYTKALIHRVEQEQRKYATKLFALDKATGNLVSGVAPEAHYAVLAAAGGTPISQMIRETEVLLKQAKDAGDLLSEHNHAYHLGQMKLAMANWLKVMPDGSSALRDDVDGRAQKLLDVVQDSSGTREDILESLDKLTRDRAALRVANEQAFYHSARIMPTDDAVAHAFEENPVHQQVVDLLADINPKDKAYAQTIIDGQARRYYEEVVSEARANAKSLRQRAAVTGDRDTRERLLTLSRQYDTMAMTTDPAIFFNHVSDVVNELSPEVIAEFSKEHGVFGEDWLFQISDMEHPWSFTPEEVASHLAIREAAGDIAHPNEQWLDDNGIPIVGDVSMEQAHKRLLLASPTAAMRAYDARFYHALDSELGGLFADEEIMSWLASQRAASPSMGVTAILKIRDALDAGEEIPLEGEGSISLAIKEMLQILRGETNLTSGAKAKISDFVDSALLSSTRTWMGHNPEGGPPIVVDRWGTRAWGVPESESAVNIIKERWGIDVEQFKGGITEPLYEQVSKKYEEFTKYLNDLPDGFDGRKDWTGLEVQAMDWAAIQRYWGADPESLAMAKGGEIRRVDFEVTQGPMGLGENLTPEQTERVIGDMKAHILRMVDKAPGLQFVRMDVDAGGWAMGSNRMVGLEVFGLEKNVMPFLTKIAQAFDQGLVQASRYRTVSKGPYGSKAALVILGEGLRDPEAKQKFFARLAELAPEWPVKKGGKHVKDAEGKTVMEKSLQGYTPSPHGDDLPPGIAIRTVRGNVSPATKGRFIAQFMDAINQVEKEQGLDLEVDARNLQLLIGSQHGPATDLDTTEGVGGIRRMADLPHAEREVRRALKQSIARAESDLLASTGADPADIARLKALDDEVDTALKRLYEEEYQGRKADYDLTADATRGRRGTRAVPKGTPLPRMRGGRVDIQRAGELAEPVERSDAAYTGPSRSGKDLAETAVLRRLRETGDPLVQKIDEAAELRARIAYAEEPDWLHALDTPKRQVLGLYKHSTKEVFISNSAHPSTWIHEFVHAAEKNDMLPPKVKHEIWKFVGARPGEDLTRAQSEDVADMFEAMFIGFDDKVTKLPPDMKAAFASMRKSMLGSPRRNDWVRARAVLDRMPEDLRLALEDVFYISEEAHKARRFHGAINFTVREGTYLPRVPGLPVSFMNAMTGPRRAATLWRRLLAHRAIHSLTVSDKHLEKEFTAALLESGHWDRDVTRGPLEGLLKAIEIEKVTKLRDGIVKAGTPIPQSPDDILVPTDPIKWAEDARDEVKTVFQIFDRMDKGLKITDQELSQVDATAIEHAKNYAFPNLSDEGREAMRVAASLIQKTQQPIEGVVWVPRRLVVDALTPARARVPSGDAARLTLGAFDSANNFLKLMTLSLNPAYYPMNLGGQGVMLASQQGPFMFISLARSLFGLKSLGDAAALIDVYSGSGLASVVGTNAGLGKGATNLMGNITRLVIDKYPRRAAFMYEARRLGYKTNAEVLDLLQNPERLNDLLIVADRSNKAMVDFGDLSQFEREWVTRAIFVYPWLKGSTKYAGQFIQNHPIQSAAFAYLLWWQQERLKDAMPEGHPGYLKWFFPISKGDPATGETPYGFRMDQFFTPLQPLDLAAEIVYQLSGGHANLPWGANEEALVSKFNPLIEELAITLTGWDSFTRQEVQKGLPAFAKRMINPQDRWASWARLKKIIDHQTHTGLYDTNQFQNWLRFWLGSPAPINVDPEKAGEMSAARQGTPSQDQSRDDWLKKVETVQGTPIEPAKAVVIMRWKQNDQIHESVSRQYREDHDLEGTSTIQDRVAILFLTLGEVLPDYKDEYKARADSALRLSDTDAQAAYTKLRALPELGLWQIGQINSRVSKMQLAKRQAEIQGATP